MKKTKRLIHSKVTLEIDSVPAPSAGDDVSQAKTTDTDGDRLPSRTEELEYITIDYKDTRSLSLLTLMPSLRKLTGTTSAESSAAAPGGWQDQSR